MKEQAKEIIEKSRVIFLATVDEDGTPRSTILLSSIMDDGEIMWRSSPEAIHSQNIARDERVGVSAFYEDDEINEFRAVYVATLARDLGNEVLDEEYQSITHEYRAKLGKYDETQSKPNRLYFKESRS